MKIAYVSTLKSSSWGGSEELWHQNAIEASNRGHQLALLVYEWPGEPEQIKQLRNKGTVIFKRSRNIPVLVRLLNILSKIFFAKKPLFLNPYRTLLCFDPDIVIVTDGSTYYTANDTDLSSVLLRYFRGKYIIICQANSNYHLPSNRKHAIELFESALNVLFVSEQNRRLAFHQLAYNLMRTGVVQNPVLLKDFERKDMPPIGTTIHCAIVGRFCISDKGQDILISMIGDTYWKGANILFHLYGKGDDKEYLEQLINYYDVADKCIIEGFSADRTAIWDKCHCLLMCSHTEGTPLTLLEAMVIGRVCVVTRVGGNEEWISDGYNGFLVEAPTAQLFSNKLREALSRIDDWHAIGINAHRTAVEKLDRNPGRTLMDMIEAEMIA